MKKLIIASFIGMIFFQSCTKENGIKPTSQPVDQSAVDDGSLLPSPDFIKETNYDVKAAEKKYIPQVPQTPPIYIPKYSFVKS